MGGTSLGLCEGRGEARVGDACSSCPTGGWREDPAEEDEERKADLRRLINLRCTSPLATG